MRKMRLVMLAIFALTSSAECVTRDCGICSCSHRYKKMVVDCSHRQLVKIPQDIPLDVVELNLAGNLLEEVPSKSFASLKKLSKLVLSFNNLTRIYADSFAGLEGSLKVLNLDVNPIPYNRTGYEDGSIGRLRRLTGLYIVTDSCPQSIDDPIVSNLTSLKELAIAVPHNGSLPRYFATLRSLDTLHLNTNCTLAREILSNDLSALNNLPIRRLSFRKSNLKLVDPRALQPLNATLRKLDFSCNVLQNITGLLVGLQGLPIETLLMDRSIYQFGSFSIGNTTLVALSSMNLSVLTLSWNNFLEVDLRSGPVLVNLPNLKYIRVGYNQVSLKVSQLSELMLVVASLIMNARVVDVNGLLRFYDGLDTVLDCNGEDLLFADKKLDWENDKLLHPPSTLSPWEWLLKARENYRHGILTMPPRMTRAYMRDLGQIFLDLSCREFPWQLNKDNNLVQVDLSFSDIPRVDCVVQGLSALYLLDASNTGLISWAPMFFSNLSAPRLHRVFLRQNKLGDFLRRTSEWAPLNGMSNVTFLDLSANGILGLPRDAFSYSPNLEILNLSSNRIEAWNISIRNAWQMKSLDLSYNLIKQVSPTAITEFDYIRSRSPVFKIYMTHNELACYACANEEFFTWALDNPSTVSGLTCVDGYERFAVSHHTVLSIKWQCLYLKILLGGISALTFASLVAAVCQSNKWSIKYWYYKARRRILGFNAPLTTDPVGVYLSYQHADREKAEIVRALLMRMGVRNVVTHEMFPPGGLVYEQIALHLDSCIAIVLLVSPEGITESTSDFEFHMALQKGVSSIVLILTTEEVPISKMTRALRKLLNMNSYIKWPHKKDSRDNDDVAAEERGLSGSFDKFYVVLEAVVGNIISRTLPCTRISRIASEQPESSDDGSVDEQRENRALITQWFLER